MIPWSTPRTITPTAATRLTVSAEVRTWAYRRRTPRSMSDRAVMMTTATKAGQKVGQEPVEKEEQDGDQACTDQAIAASAVTWSHRRRLKPDDGQATCQVAGVYRLARFRLPCASTRRRRGRQPF